MEYRDITPELEKISAHFQYREPPDVLVRIQDFLSWLMRSIADFLKQFNIMMPGLANTDAVGNIMQVVIVIAGGICLLVILYFTFTRMKHLREQASLAKRGAASLEDKLDAAGWRSKAAEFAGQGHFKEACRALYLSIIYLLDEKKILDFVPTRTNYEYWYALSGKERLQIGFRRLADRVEVMWFGNHVAETNDYDHCLELLNGLEDEVRVAEEKMVKIEGKA